MNFKSYHEAEPDVRNNAEFHEIQKDFDQVRNYQLLRRILHRGVVECKTGIYPMFLMNRYFLKRNR